MGRAIDDDEEVSVSFGRRQRSNNVDIDVGESALRLGKCANPGFSVAVEFGSLAEETGTGPSLCVNRDAVPYKLLLEEGSCRMGGRMGEAVDKVKDSTTEKKRNPRARAAGTLVAEDCSPVVIDEDVLPLKGREGHLTGGCLGVLHLQAGEMVVDEAETDQ